MSLIILILVGDFVYTPFYYIGIVPLLFASFLFFTLITSVSEKEISLTFGPIKLFKKKIQMTEIISIEMNPTLPLSLKYSVGYHLNAHQSLWNAHLPKQTVALQMDAGKTLIIDTQNASQLFATIQRHLNNEA